MDTIQEITINGNRCSFTPGETILRVAKRHHINIPTLCHLKGVNPSGVCRVCMVEVEGSKKLMASCATQATAGMVIQTESTKVVEARKMIIRLMLSSGNHNCAIRGCAGNDWTAFQLRVHEADGSDDLCPVWGDCRLQDLAYRYQVSGDPMLETKISYPMETVNPFIVRDFSRCILCGRCVQACNDVQVNNAINFGYQSAFTKIVTAGDKPLKDSDCVFCGECVQVCPVGALVEKDARYNVRPWWIQKKVRTTCGYCGVGCQLHLHVKDDKVVKVSGAEGVPPNHGSLCVKGRFGFDFIHSPERLTQPLIKRNGVFHEADWEEALDVVSKKLASIKDQYGNDSLGVLASARITNEDNYIAQKFARAVLKTNNVDHCARLCHASTVAGLAAAFGSGAMTNPMADVFNSDVILITGSNPTENHPVMSSFIKRSAVFGKTKLIVVDPRNIAIGQFAAIKLTQRLGTDVCWINGMMHVIIEENLHDQTFVRERTEGFEELKQAVEKYNPEYVEAVADIPKNGLIDAARLYAKASAAGIIYCMGITQHSTGTDNVKSLANLAMLCGNMGIVGGGVNPLRGQNNVQGACDMGALPNVFSGYQPVTDPNARRAMEAAWHVEELPDKAGLTVTQMLPMAHQRFIRAMYVIGENPMVSDPDLNHTEECLKRLDFLVVQDIFLTETAKLADVVLPAASFAEKDGTFTNTERKVQRVRKAVEPFGAARQDWQITCDIASRMGYPMAYADAKSIFDEISGITPSYKGISHDRIENDGLHWPCPAPDHSGTPILHTKQFTRGKGKFHAVEHLPPAEVPDDDYPLFLTTGRILYHYHTGAMTMKTDGLNTLAPECFVEISEEDAQRHGVLDGKNVRVETRRGEILARARITPRIRPGTIFIPFHYARSAANRLTHAALDPVCNIPELKVCAARLSPFYEGVI